jgi:hypothetical protein
MDGKRVLLVCADHARAQWVLRVLGASVGGVAVFRADAAGPWSGGVPVVHDLILYDLADGEGLGGVDLALWARSMSPRPAPLVVIGDRYDPWLAVTLFRMGVTDYLGLDAHPDRLPALVAGLLGLPTRGDGGASRPGPAREGEPAVAASTAG